MTHDFKTALNDLKKVECEVTALKWFKKWANHINPRKNTAAAALTIAANNPIQTINNAIDLLIALRAQCEDKTGLKDSTRNDFFKVIDALKDMQSKTGEQSHLPVDVEFSNALSALDGAIEILIETGGCEERLIGLQATRLQIKCLTDKKIRIVGVGNE